MLDTHGRALEYDSTNITSRLAQRLPEVYSHPGLPCYVTQCCTSSDDVQADQLELPALTPPEDPVFNLDVERVKRGAMAFATNACLVCHGMNAIGGGAAPDLRYSPLIVNQEAFKAVVKDGALQLNGMPSSPHVSDEQLEEICYYLSARAKQSAANAH